jgi:hypothetical protein
MTDAEIDYICELWNSEDRKRVRVAVNYWGDRPCLPAKVALALTERIWRKRK